MGLWKIKGSAFKNLEIYFINKTDRKNIKDFVVSWPEVVLVSSWYDAEIYIETENRIAEMIGKPSQSITLDSALFTLELDLNDIYKFFMKLGGIERVLGHGGSIAKTYMNFAEQQTLENKKQYFRASAETPASLTDWYITKTEGAFTGVLSVFSLQKKGFNLLSRKELQKNGILYSATEYELIY